MRPKRTRRGGFNRYFIPIGRYKVSVFIDNEKVWENVIDVCSPGSNCLGGKDSRVLPPIALRTSKGGEGGGNQAAYAKLNQEFQRGRDMFKKKNFTMAAQAFQKAAAMDPDQQVIHAFLGDTYRQMRKYDQAVDSYQKALTALAKKKPNPKLGSRLQNQPGRSPGHGRKGKGSLRHCRENLRTGAQTAIPDLFQNCGGVRDNGQTKGGSRNLPEVFGGRSQ